jgi:ATP-dependent HslUV protease, peptidase subunit HslV
MLRQLEAMLIVADGEQILTLSGSGDVVGPTIPSPPSAPAAPTPRQRRSHCCAHTTLDAATIARTALLIAAEIDLYTSGTPTVLTIGGGGGAPADDDGWSGGSDPDASDEAQGGAA